MVIVEMKKHFQQRALEWWSAGVMASWGIFVLCFPSMFTDEAIFKGLLMVAPQHAWGIVATLAGLLRLAALFVNGFWKRTPAIRWATAMIAILIWFLIAAGLVASQVVTTGIIVYAWHMVADMYSAFRSASDYIEGEFQRKLKSMEVASLPEDRGTSNVRSLSAR
jgi:uncharacterized membrane protein